jgi:hypothetical protein
VAKIDEELINSIMESQKELTSQFYVSWLDPELGRLVDKIYKD